MMPPMPERLDYYISREDGKKKFITRCDVTRAIRDAAAEYLRERVGLFDEVHCTVDAYVQEESPDFTVIEILYVKGCGWWRVASGGFSAERGELNGVDCQILAEMAREINRNAVSQ